MAKKMKVPGVHAASGQQGFSYPLGDYLFECQDVEIIEKDLHYSYRFKMQALDYEGDAKGTKDEPIGRKYTHFVVVMKEEHPSFNEWHEIAANEIKAMALAFGVTVSKTDNIDFEEFVGQTAWGRMIFKAAKEGKENDRDRYEVAEWFADEEE